MATGEKTKPAGFRLTDETLDKFREISRQIGGNQQETMAALIEAYEYEAGKQALPEQQTNIETFEGYLRAVSQLYRQSLETVQNMRTITRTEYVEELNTKDSLIADLHKRVQDAEASVKDYSDKINMMNEDLEKKSGNYKEQIMHLNEKIADLQKLLSESENNREEDRKLLQEAKNSEASFKKMFLDTKDEADKCREDLDRLSSRYKTSYDLVGKLTKEKNELQNEMQNSINELKHTVERKDLEINALKEKTDIEISSLREKSEITLQLELQKIENKLKAEFADKAEEYQKRINELMKINSEKE